MNDNLDTMFDNCFYSSVNKPTRITNTSATLLDHDRTTLFSRDIKARVLLHLIADHLARLIYFYTKETTLQREIKTRIFNHSNKQRFYQELEKTIIKFILQETDSNVAFHLFIDKYTNAVNSSKLKTT